ncbi:maleylpyruvate isomerase family mycothiol-dependent enzyme [Nocardia terpenica]|uniref:maleylpyruvate isomerase family mycothiol-dependent enzyme n=1 Tax=Nocardia terpenica TaxID=455432 RepID=UPI00189357DF|nr:maleylpyruvate isomerase family mycothiol-dependent enzyme [Nocardia terpenica]MBF6059481.1 maleylpyruvate isomerase family mycothiol-dependent enzyme [Nocardia terpenica]MBF6102980.1 maleylpyruvate isomerase family mycothiol-dependent enzyme [Nocardia terpenica]MBF6110831.1 maleylpyruvate isomerase family mycothiol-dependent enzyme [Nocardia terpenica]MBF6116962.1 maleylpyruvate isomerase family mycothiol-dependent enzyme [Nocardia terpenica]MBF6151200.1 maleylpyruvate isomerase family myc
MSELLRLDAAALALLGHDVVTVSDAELSAPTPCTGWTVADLIDHMNQRHEAVIATVLAPLDDHADNPRDDFARTAARWVVAMEQAGDRVTLPDRGPITRERLLPIHFLDMLVHRWDLCRALSRPYPVPDRFLAVALPTARAITGPDSEFHGPGGAYELPVETNSALPVMDSLAALLGRDPSWEPPRA